MERLGVALFFIILGCGVAGWFVSYVFYRHLRNHHRKVWTDLGSPTLFFNASMKNQASVGRFLWGNHYKRLDDRYIHRLALTMKVLGVIIVVLFLLAVVLTLRKGSAI